MPAAREFVESAIAADTVVIFSKSSCPYCKMAKEVFDKLNQAYKAIELNERKDGDEIQDVLLEMTGARTVPRVFIKGECIGGGTDCKKMFDNGELQKKL
ncbi:glutaredoxin-C3-like isoform X2 [Aphidius gifuensis]|nr:glutaredoxin-C3-like isoform X2 [Aphidius gifuensis]